MNIRNISRITAVGAALIVVLPFASPRTLAGPGPQYWQSLGKTKPEMTAPAAQPSGTLCTDFKIVTVTETKNGWANGRGPLQVSEIGTKRVCTACGSFTVMKADWPNGRGPLHPVQVAGSHDCTAECVLPTPRT